MAPISWKRPTLTGSAAVAAEPSNPPNRRRNAPAAAKCATSRMLPAILHNAADPATLIRSYKTPNNSRKLKNRWRFSSIFLQDETPDGFSCILPISMRSSWSPKTKGKKKRQQCSCLSSKALAYNAESCHLHAYSATLTICDIFISHIFLIKIC